MRTRGPRGSAQRHRRLRPGLDREQPEPRAAARQRVPRPVEDRQARVQGPDAVVQRIADEHRLGFQRTAILGTQHTTGANAEY